jgi:hypothetical protein
MEQQFGGEQKPTNTSSPDSQPPLNDKPQPADAIPAEQLLLPAVSASTEHKTTPTGKTNEVEPLPLEERIARWGEVSIEDDDELFLYLPEQNITLPVDLKPDSRIFLGRPQFLTPSERQGGRLPETTIPIMTPAERRRLLERSKNIKSSVESEAKEEQKAIPWLDLEPYDGEAKGVSRKHALVERQNRLLYITDLDSRNGTRINGDLLAPSHRRLIRNGDELRLGGLVLQVQIKQPARVEELPPDQQPATPPPSPSPTDAPTDKPGESGRGDHPSELV